MICEGIPTTEIAQTRQEARDKGLRYYFGRKCERDHPTFRRVTDGANMGVYCDNVVISNCLTTGTSYGAISNLYGCNGLIIDRCTCNLYLLAGVRNAIKNILFTNNILTNATLKKLVLFNRSISAINIRAYNNTSAAEADPFAFTVPSSQSARISNFSVETETPYILDNGIDFALKPGYNGQRIKTQLGKFRGFVPERYGA